MKNRRGLGKGLDALLAEDSDSPEFTPERAAAEKGAAKKSSDAGAGAESGGRRGGSAEKSAARMFPLSDLRPGTHQPRRNFDEESLEELAESIRRHGVLQPLLVRPLGGGEGWEIVAGERRWRAAQMAGVREIPAAVREMTDKEAMFAALVENLQREDLNPMERARGILRLVEDLGMTHAAAGAEVGLTRSAVSNILRLLELSSAVQRMVEEGKLEAGHARALAALSPEAQQEAARRIVSRKLSAREAEALAKRMSRGADGGGSGGKKGGEGAKDADIRGLEREMSSRLKARTEIQHRKSGGGKLTIHYGSLDALDGILAKLRK